MCAELVLVLASNSPRRRVLFSLLGWDFAVRVATVDESLHPGETAGDYVLRLAREKALACAGTAVEEVIIAADTAVVDGPDILGKPKDAVEAGEMLRRLRGHTHQVYTGIAVLRVADGSLLTNLCITDVPMRFYSGAEMVAYVATGDPFDKAGAYAIQHAGFDPVESLSGCFASVMGLPLCHLTHLLRRMNVVPAADVPVICQSTLSYSCSIHSAALCGEQMG